MQCMVDVLKVTCLFSGGHYLTMILDDRLQCVYSGIGSLRTVFIRSYPLLIIRNLLSSSVLALFLTQLHYQS